MRIVGISGGYFPCSFCSWLWLHVYMSEKNIRSGEHGGVILPITEKWTSNDRYVISCTFSLSYVNTGIVSVVRDRYVEEEDPLYRLTLEVAQLIADQLGIDISGLKYLARANIGAPVDPTERIKEYVKSDRAGDTLQGQILSINNPPAFDDWGKIFYAKSSPFDAITFLYQ